MILEIAKATLPSGGGGLLELLASTNSWFFDISQISQEVKNPAPRNLAASPSNADGRR